MIKQKRFIFLAGLVLASSAAFADNDAYVSPNDSQAYDASGGNAHDVSEPITERWERDSLHDEAAEDTAKKGLKMLVASAMGSEGADAARKCCNGRCKPFPSDDSNKTIDAIREIGTKAVLAWLIGAAMAGTHGKRLQSQLHRNRRRRRC